MSFGDAVSTCFSKYAVIGGRASRSEYWFFHLFFLLLVLALALFAVLAGSFQPTRAPGAASLPGVVALLGGIALLLGMFLPHLCVTVRRLHDTGASGWFYLLFFFPYIGGLIGIVWMCIPGSKGRNKYGPSPFDQPEDVF
jgi:uncharacterized membrane protein YhaH (DUF805 family)